MQTRLSCPKLPLRGRHLMQRACVLVMFHALLTCSWRGVRGAASARTRASRWPVRVSTLDVAYAWRMFFESERRVVVPLCICVLTFLCRESAAVNVLLPGNQPITTRTL